MHIIMKTYKRPTITNVAIGTDSIIAASLPLGKGSTVVSADEALSKQIDIWVFEEMEEEKE